MKKENCNKKKRYETKEEARKAKRALFKKYGMILEPYPCDIHHCFHLAHKNKKAKPTFLFFKEGT